MFEFKICIRFYFVANIYLQFILNFLRSFMIINDWHSIGKDKRQKNEIQVLDLITFIYLYYKHKIKEADHNG